MITTIDKAGFDLITGFEGLKLKPYLCPSKIPTIGYGNTYYGNGTRVTLKDAPITKEKAIQLFNIIVKPFELGVNSYIVDTISQNQFNSLVSFAYNCGLANLRSSTLLKKVNANINDKNIALEFAKWNKGNGKILQGLVNRRLAESNMYFKQ